MFRIIRDFVPKPVVQVVCDRSCGHAVNMVVEPGNEDRPEVHTQFLQGVSQQGWKLSLTEQVCPAHVQKEAGEQPMILVPHGRMEPLKN